MFNVNNLWTPENGRPGNYRELIQQVNTDKWIHSIHDNVLSINIDMKKHRWIVNAFGVGSITGRIPKGYDEEFDSLEKSYIIPPNENGWFVRLQYNSLKYGCHGTGPYYTIRQIVESMVTTKCTHRIVEEDDDECILYFLPWIQNFDIDKEFRVFVFNNEITAVTVQYIYSRNDWICNVTEKEQKQIVNSLCQYFNQNIKYIILSYVIDIYIFDENNWYFIEPNPFGAEGPSGLFHWNTDHDKLTKSETINFCYTL